MSDSKAWITAIRQSHDRFTTLVAGLGDDELSGPSYASEWTIAQVASHLGSQGEIFALLLDAGLSGGPTPGGEVFAAIWDRWNALSPAQQVVESVQYNETLVARFEQLTPAEQQGVALGMFGTELDLTGLATMRLGEHALHTWDIAVALNPSATVAPEAVDLLIDAVPQTAARAGQPVADAKPISVLTTDPERRFLLTLGPDLSVSPTTETDDGALQLPAEAMVRLVYGRLDPQHTPVAVAGDSRLDQLRTAFPGF